MNENFDATQFITFDIFDYNEHIIKQIRENFENLGFEVLQGNDIRKVKKKYFKQYMKTVFIELMDVNFFGEIESWQANVDMPTERIENFAEQLIWLFNQKEVSNLSLILTGFAEEGISSDKILKVTSDEIIKGIFAMSKYNFDIWTDNLILEIV